MLSWSFFCLCVFCLFVNVLGQSFNPVSLSQRRRQTPAVVLPRNFSPRAVQEAFARAASVISSRRRIGGRRRPGARSVSEARHQRFQGSGPRSIRLEVTQEQFEEATRILLEEFNLTPEQIMFGLTETDLRTMLEGNEVGTCEAQFNFTNCRANDRYRSIDGTCNNLKHPSWGMAASCFERLVDPDYADGTAAKRVARSGNPLPAPRTVTLQIHNHIDNPTDYVNHLFMIWGQFLDHDISLTPLGTGPNNEVLECCPVSDEDPPQCDPIIIERDDPFFSSLGVDCLSNARSAMCSTCTLGPRQQTNQVTSYIDASLVYGLNLNQSNGLRNMDGSGTLRSINDANAGELLPTSFNPGEDQCSFQDDNLNCFEAGDQRVNQHPAVTSMHTIYLREHNRIARRLRELNPRWNEERLFQEARRIVGAEMQMIVYNEFLPLVIGPERMEWFDLSVRRTGYTQYDETVQATLVHEFSTAAFRFGHSLINSYFQDSRGTNEGNLLRDIFSFPFGLYSGQVEGILQGSTGSPAQKFDRHIVPDVTNHLYKFRGNESGLDLASLNVNRGRDHGVPGYTTIVEFCGGPQINRFQQLDRLFQRNLRPLFERLYESVHDIDFFSGGLAERPNQGSVVGPTFTCVIGIQFYHLKYGDRFYFEHGGQPGSFTPDQLAEIRKVTIGKLMCDNSEIDQLPQYSFLYQNARNPLIRCNERPEMNLNAWRE